MFGNSHVRMCCTDIVRFAIELRVVFERRGIDEWKLRIWLREMVGHMCFFCFISFVLFHLARNVFAKCTSDFVFVIVHRISSFERWNNISFSAWLLIFFLIALQSSTFLQNHKIWVFLDGQNFFYFFNIKIIIWRCLATAICAWLVAIRENLGCLTKHC